MVKKEERMKKGEGLEEFLLRMDKYKKWSEYHGDRSCHEAYVQIRKKLIPFQELVELGAMRDSALRYQADSVEALDKASEEDFKKTVYELLEKDPVIFLNDHGPGHVAKVVQRADDIVQHFSGAPLSEFEAFVVLCAIQIHDIGNILGRSGHELKLHEIFDQNCKDIILDAPERRLIASIAAVHGGKTERGKDTISQLDANEDLFEITVRSRMLAAIVRLADELADDSTRAHVAAIDLGILGINSAIYHEYSEALHTVKIQPDLDNDGCKIKLVYEIREEQAVKVFETKDKTVYLLDEIYARTRKMELERRYCMKFMQQYVNIGRIEVIINIYRPNVIKPVRISYTLEDVTYPTEKDIDNITDFYGIAVPTGAEVYATYFSQIPMKKSAAKRSV